MKNKQINIREALKMALLESQIYIKNLWVGLSIPLTTHLCLHQTYFKEHKICLHNCLSWEMNPIHQSWKYILIWNLKI